MIRGVGLRGAVAVNMITMIGIGPLITIPLVVASLHGGLSLVGWVLGALVAMCDGLVWAELGSLYPGSGGTYVFLREVFGRRRWGSLMSFLFVWQFMLSAPLLLASGYIGFAHYAEYFWHPTGSVRLLEGAVATGVGLVTLGLLYRSITSVTKITIVLWIAAVTTLCAVIAAAVPHADFARALSLEPQSARFGAGFLAGIASALYVTLYDYMGYSDVCTIGDEVRRPNRTIPLAIVLSIGFVAVLYIVMNVGVLGVVSWHEMIGGNGVATDAATFVASTTIERTWGSSAAKIVTALILVTAFASTFGLLLGFARIPYAAALDGAFFAPFGRLHPSGKFPHVALVTLGLLALPACFLSLDQVIAILTTGLVLIQGVAQIVALAVVRARRIVAPFRMWLFPLPALVALAGWSVAFVGTGSAAIAFGVVTLAAGALVFVVRARIARRWPFAVAAAALTFLSLSRAPASASYGSAAIVQRDGYPVFTVAGKPFFPYGAAFFYERLPRAQWRESLLAHKRMGINTIDLYVMWNWHELADGDFDFTGRTSPRRDLIALMRLVRELDLHAIVRPGPVIRNEWRNAGYPAWLLVRPEYGMPLHDLLEGRYPPTATLQNAHSDDAAAQWLGNQTHLRYARRWLSRVLHELKPFGDRVIAVAIDDDQGAYIDNQTWPAPHLAAYLRTLARVVRDSAGPMLPLFVNTYQMKVTASSPLWAMGNWYQSDALKIGEHDRAQLEFSTGLLQTQRHLPVMASEFQAGWLAPPDEVRARQTDPSNTVLALHTLLAMGARGIVNFPAQDTLYPSGMEVPFANAFYAWEAALTLDGRPSARYAPTEAFGRIVTDYGVQLAQTHRAADAAIAYLTSAYDERLLKNDDVFDIAARTQESQRFCRLGALTCDLVDLRFADAATLARYPIVFVPRPEFARRGDRRFVPAANAALARVAQSGGAIVTLDRIPTERATARRVAEAALRQAHRVRAVEGVQDATLMVGGRAGGLAFLDVVNYGETEVAADHVTVGVPGGRLRLAPFRVPARGAVTLPIRGRRARLESRPAAVPTPSCSHALPVRRDAPLCADLPSTDDGSAVAYEFDAYGEGSPAVVLENALVRVIFAPRAGARAFVFEDKATHASAFTSVGALRDDVAIQFPPSTTDRIRPWTSSFAAGFFNRPYGVAILQSGPRAVVRFSYEAPDVLPNGARFARTVTLERGARAFTVDESASFPGADERARDQRAVTISSLALGPDPVRDGWVLTPQPRRFAAGQNVDVATGGALGFFDERTHELTTIAWLPGDVLSAELNLKTFSLVSRLTLAPKDTVRTAYGFASVRDLGAASACVTALSQGRGFLRSNSRAPGEVAERSTQSPQKRSSESSCGFESHLP